MFYLKGQKHNLSGDVCFKLSNTEVSPPFFNQSLTAENQDCESREATLWIMEWGYKKAVWKHSCDWISGENRSGFICCNCKLTPTANFPGVHFPLEGNKPCALLEFPRWLCLPTSLSPSLAREGRIHRQPEQSACVQSPPELAGTVYPEDGSRSFKCVDWQHSNSLWRWHNYSTNLETKDATVWIVQLHPSLQFPRPSAAEFWLKGVNTGMHHIHTGHHSRQLSRKMSTGLRKVIEGDKPCCGLIVMQKSKIVAKAPRSIFSHINVTASNFEIKTHSWNSKSWKGEERARRENLQQKNTDNFCSSHWRVRAFSSVSIRGRPFLSFPYSWPGSSPTKRSLKNS